jgi:hypothetical protein
METEGLERSKAFRTCIGMIGGTERIEGNSVFWFEQGGGRGWRMKV